MSLIMYSVDHDRRHAEMVVDTVCYTVNDRVEPVGFGSKAIVYAHALCVMGQRGSMQWLWQVHDGLAKTYCGVSGLDGIVEALPSIARAAHADWPAINNELHLVGYSKAHGGFNAVRLLSKNSFEPEERATGAHFSGVDHELKATVEPPSVGQWISAAIGLREQCQAKSWIGGDLILHTLTPSGIGIQKVFRFSDFPETLEMIESRWQRKTTSPSSSTPELSSLDTVNC